MNSTAAASPFAIDNVRRFVAFRVFFNARFYYPVFTILFLDLGLTIKDFALLNAVWAVTIVVLEVPSGALADIVGRKALLVFAAALMVIEMLLLCVAPLGKPGLLFAVLLANRILSGTAEAAASGADEALAYDSLVQNGKSAAWGLVLEKQVRWQSIGFMVAMTCGAAVYDPSLMQAAADVLGLEWTVSQDVSLRFPVFLTLLMALMALANTLGMRETAAEENSTCTTVERCRRSLAASLRLTVETGGWIVHTPFALVLIAAGLVFDNVIRMLITLNSQYYRLIAVPEAAFGIIGSALAALGLIVPRLARWLSRRQTPWKNWLLMTAMTFCGLYGVTFFMPWFGILPVAVLMSVMYMSGFFLSHYLNHITPSSRRATVLSFKGLSYNLAYGLAGMLYAILLSQLRPGVSASHPQLGAEALQDAVFIASIQWFPWYFAGISVVFLVFARRRLRHSKAHLKRFQA